MGEFGQKLKQEREKKGVTLEEVALATKIGTRMLRAIEEERFDRLPGGIFNKGFVRAYAKHLGLNEEEAVAAYLAALNATLPQPPVIEPEPEVEEVQEIRASTAKAGLLSWGRLALALLMVAVALGFWNLRSRRAVPNPAPIAAKTAPTPMTAAPAQKQEPAPVQQTTARPTNTAPTPKPASAQPASPPEVSQAAGLFHVLVRAREDSWVRVVADGKEVMQDTLLADGQRYVAAEREIVIRSGNVGGLDFWFNGQKLPSQGDADQVKTVTFDPRGLVAPTAQVQTPASNAVNQP